ncbi:S-adenosyl-L-methionine-dependent methyltransferase [Annulohypoxylon maeteangense]|uniref:S-adenosyl-L-methionine-dependent methyltransferase n=1 Tax=Annulohypoxylon maeteangense TaxID=1927788 RepID=UPI0020079363|nr:S-adenosyl-L-methionine-dependent methyltransferase [Annulohypoxylon maeteangense]KAI0887606.1 S-adenosyl-L-methionine-dependent methyltransferase [Annulohypoxylon maeteangense]
MASETPNVDKVAQALKQVAEDGEKFMTGDQAARERLVASARELVLAAETPVETVLWNIWAVPTRTVASRIAVDLKIFETAVKNGGCPKSSEDLAAATGASPTLVKRISRACVSMGMLDEQRPDVYVPNDVTRLLAIKEYAAGITFSFDITQLSFAKMPAYLRSTNFQNPEDSTDGPFQYANNCPSAFSWLVQHPDVFEAFHDYVHTLRLHRPAWTDMYPVRSKLIKGLKPDGDASVFVDIGGGTGQILQDFRSDVPQYTGRLILQEIPEVVAAATEKGVGADGRIELQVHDFFTPQPIKGARAYFMRSVLHDWPDEQCRKILAQLKDVMEPGYSKILISDCVISDQNAAWQHISMDLYMMAQLSSRERTEREWRELIDSCGLDIVGIYNKGDGNEGLIEVVRSV